MINLQPYQNPTYFVLLAVALLPLAIGLLYGKRFKVYEMIVSFAFLLLTFGGVKLNEGLSKETKFRIRFCFGSCFGNCSAFDFQTDAFCYRQAFHFGIFGHQLLDV